MSAPVLFSVEELTVRFASRGGRGPVKALDAVSLDWHEGEVLGLVGASGSGKSTLGRCLMGLQRPSAGQVRYRGRPLAEALRDGLRREVQMVFQDPYTSLNPRHTVGEQVREGLDIHRIGAAGAERDGLARAALEGCGLAPAEQYGHRLPHELSGGQRQRVVIAGAMALGPKALVCDEPVSALDVSVRSQVLGLLTDLHQRQNLGYLFITHDVGLAWALCDRVAVLQNGRLVECGPTESVLGDPQHEYTRALLAAVPTTSGATGRA
jgi:peptide/nickel transport system ATP-binding protein